MVKSTVIVNANIADGRGGVPFEGSVRIVGGRIDEIALAKRLPTDPGEEVVNADGRVLAPGFIDLHSHADYTIQGSPAAVTQLTQGVTTLLVGNCGLSPFPTVSPRRTARESAHLDSAFAGEWESTEEFAALCASVKPGVNVALQLGLSALRDYIVGGEDRPAEPHELVAMGAVIRDAARAGARGFSSGLIYAPGSYTSREELQVLLAEVVSSGLLYSTHIRDEAGALIPAIDEALDSAEAAGARLQISHIKAIGPANHGGVVRALEHIDEARLRGLDVAADVYPYTASSTVLTSRLPGYALDGGAEQLSARLEDPSMRTRIARDLAARFGRDVDPEGVVIAALGPVREGFEPYNTWVGRSLVEIGRAQGCTPEEAALRVLHSHRGSVSIVNHAMAESDVEAAIRHPLVSIASDGWTLSDTGLGRPHPRTFGTFPRVLGRYVRERGVISLGEAVRKMTALPASRIGLRDRGVIARGAVADLVLFDPETVADRSSYDDPWKLSVGVSDVWIAGRSALREGLVMEERWGSVI